jgi:hypothetical protein
MDHGKDLSINQIDTLWCAFNEGSVVISPDNVKRKTVIDFRQWWKNLSIWTWVYCKEQVGLRPLSCPKNISVFCIKIKSTEIPNAIAKVYFGISLNRFFDSYIFQNKPLHIKLKYFLGKKTALTLLVLCKKKRKNRFTKRYLYGTLWLNVLLIIKLID